MWQIFSQERLSSRVYLQWEHKRCPNEAVNSWALMRPGKHWDSSLSKWEMGEDAILYLPLKGSSDLCKPPWTPRCINDRLLMQASKFAPNNMEFENVVQHSGFCSILAPQEGKLPYKWQRQCVRLSQNRREKSPKPRTTKACYKTRAIILVWSKPELCIKNVNVIEIA